MSPTPVHSKTVETLPYRANSHRQQSGSHSSIHSVSGSPLPADARSVLSSRPRPQNLLGSMQKLGKSAESTDIKTSLPLSIDILEEGFVDDLSTTGQDPPDGLYPTVGSPGVARRAKAHVPSACVNCKRKHLACETRRPCRRCVQTGKESSCIDVQHRKRGRPRLREEEENRGSNLGSEYSRPRSYPSQPGVLPPAGTPQRGYRRSGSYREIRSQPGGFYNDQQTVRSGYSRTSDPFPALQHVQAPSHFPVSPPRSSMRVSIPTALLNTELILAEHNEAFSHALSLPSHAKKRALIDLVIPSEKEKIKRLQNSLRAELRDTARLPPMRSTGHLDGLPNIEELDLERSSTGFQTRSEYWTFRLPNELSRGFPISISLAKTNSYFVILTLVLTAYPLGTLPSQRSAQGLWSQPLPSPASIHGGMSPSVDHHSLHQPLRIKSGSSTGHSYSNHSSPVSPPAAEKRSPLVQASHAAGLAQYRQHLPPQRPLSYEARTIPPGPVVTSSPQVHRQDMPRENLRHLQLPPIRTTDIQESTRRVRTETSSEKVSPSKGSREREKRKKRRRVDIEEILQ